MYNYFLENNTPETTTAGANSSGTDSDPFDSAKSTPQMESVCVCVEEYNPSTSGHLQLAKGDLVESKKLQIQDLKNVWTSSNCSIWTKMCPCWDKFSGTDGKVSTHMNYVYLPISWLC